MADFPVTVVWKSCLRNRLLVKLRLLYSNVLKSVALK